MCLSNTVKLINNRVWAMLEYESTYLFKSNNFLQLYLIDYL